jgi:UDP-N-acetylmuramate dehydrogenase
VEYFKQLCEILRTPPLVKEPLSQHTSLGVGGPADYLVNPHDTVELRDVLLFARENQIPTLVLGHGTNLLVLDEGYHGIAISLVSACSHCNFSGHRVQAGANIALPWLANEVARRGLSGMEFAAGIPGTLGGALFMNAGAFGYYTADLVEEVVTMDRAGCMGTRPRSELNFAYRWSNFQDEDVIILEATLALKPGDRQSIEELQRQMLDKRAARHPRQPSAGSVFRNPPDKTAGYLIEQAGLKGLTVGGAQISPMHGNFIVNNGNATASDILNLISIVKESVREKFGMELQLEIRVVGETGR